MKRITFLIILLLVIGCGSDPATIDENSQYNPAVHTLESIVLDGAQTLALKESDAAVQQTMRATQGVAERCDELGRIDGAIYSKLETQGKGGSLVPCFKNIQFWDSQTIYGQYRPDNSTDSVWFITDSNGKVHHLPKAPKKGLDFKSDKLIRHYQGKPVYLDSESYLTSFNFDTDEEERIIENPIGRFVIIPKNNGEHIVYHDLSGGKIRRPSGSQETLPELNTYKFYYKNPGNDLTYIAYDNFFVNMTFDNSGFILERSASSVPIAYQDSIDNPIIGAPPITGPSNPGFIGNCEISENLIICGNKGFVIADSSVDMEEINWCDFGHCSQYEPISCLNNEYIYFYSRDSNYTDQKLTQINRNLSLPYEHILSNIQIDKLICLDDGGLLIGGYNTQFSKNETFHFDPATKVKTIITEPVSKFIN